MAAPGFYPLIFNTCSVGLCPFSEKLPQQKKSVWGEAVFVDRRLQFRDEFV